MTDFVDRFYSQMTAGEKQHMANKLWKDNSVGAKKLLDTIEKQVQRIQTQSELIDEQRSKLQAEPEVTYQIGQRFTIPRFGTSEYILGAVSGRECALINLEHGTHASSPKVVGNTRAVTAEELFRIAGSSEVNKI